MHTKEAWEYILTNRRDVEDKAGVFESYDTPDEFRRGLMKLEERELAYRLGLRED